MGTGSSRSLELKFLLNYTSGSYCMPIQLTVPTIACEACAEAVTKAIQSQDGAAQVAVDVPTKVVTISSQLSEAALKQSIEAAGHEVA